MKDDQKDNFYDEDLAQHLEYSYNVNEYLFDLSNEILLLKEHDSDAHGPILATIEPSDMSRQERRPFLTDDSRKQQADRRKAEQKARNLLPFLL